MEYLLQLFVILLLARCFGEVFHRFGQPCSVGEILAGVITALAAVFLAPVTPFLSELRESPVVGYAAEGGIFALILLAGVEMQPQRIVQRSLRSVLVALGGAALPFALGILVALHFLPPGPQQLAQALLVGIALSITAIPASARVLQELGIMQSECARTILAAALIDDVIGLLLLAVMVAVLSSDMTLDLVQLALVLVKVFAFFTISILFGKHIYPHVRRGVELMQAFSMELSVLILGAMAYGLLAELLGLHWILGPFMAGLFFEPDRVGKSVYREVKISVSGIANGILGPMFFFTIGLSLDLSAVTAAPVFLATVIGVAFIGKIVGAGFPAYLLGLSKGEATAVGIGMCSRGAVELVILSIALEWGLGLADSLAAQETLQNLFSALVLTAIVTTLATPIMLREALRRLSIGPKADLTADR